MRATLLRLQRSVLRVLAAVEAPPRRCFEAGCSAPGTHRISIVVRAERGERVDVLARVTVPAVLCSDHATADGLPAIATLPRDHRRQLEHDLERRFGVPIDWSRSVVEVRHRFLAWLLWRAS